MKANQKIRRAYPGYRPAYPNAASPEYFRNKLVDGILAVTTGIGAITIVFFLITM